MPAISPCYVRELLRGLERDGHIFSRAQQPRSPASLFSHLPQRGGKAAAPTYSYFPTTDCIDVAATG